MCVLELPSSHLSAHTPKGGCITAYAAPSLMPYPAPPPKHQKGPAPHPHLYEADCKGVGFNLANELLADGPDELMRCTEYQDVRISNLHMLKHRHQQVLNPRQQLRRCGNNA
jgi:hypothetical protein